MFWFIRKRVDKLVQDEFERRKKDLELQVKSEENRLKLESQKNSNDLKVLVASMNTQIDETRRVREKAEEEQKRLWERLDILRDNLNTEDVWVKLWECAYSKATDKVWEIMKKETLHLVELSKDESYVKARNEFNEKLENRINELISKNSDLVNIPLMLKIRSESQNQYLLAEKTGDRERFNYNKGKVDLIAEIYNEKV